ncbi:MAG: phospholipid-binding protein MlaC [Methylomonas sp.]
MAYQDIVLFFNDENMLMFAKLLIALVFCLFSLNVFSNDAKQAQQIVEDTASQIKLRMSDEVFAKDFKKVTVYVDSLIETHTDFDLIANLVLGKLWKEATDNQKQQFKTEFRKLLVRTYARAFMEINNWTINYLPIIPQSDGKKLVIKTQVIQSGQKPISIDYKMYSEGEQWKIYDLIIEGVSLVTNYRTIFKNDNEKSKSLDSIIDELKVKNTNALK